MALNEQLLLVEYVAWGYPARSTAWLECADRQKISARYGIAARGPAGGARNRPATGLKTGPQSATRNGLIKLQNTLLQ